MTDTDTDYRCPFHVRHPAPSYPCYDCAWGEARALRKREALWQKYVSLLSDEHDALAGLAMVHGWKGSTKENYEEGRRLRKALGINAENEDD